MQKLSCYDFIDNIYFLNRFINDSVIRLKYIFFHKNISKYYFSSKIQTLLNSSVSHKCKKYYFLLAFYGFFLLVTSKWNSPIATFIIHIKDFHTTDFKFYNWQRLQSNKFMTNVREKVLQIYGYIVLLQIYVCWRIPCSSLKMMLKSWVKLVKNERAMAIFIFH